MRKRKGSLLFSQGACISAFLQRLWLKCLKLRFWPLSNGSWMGLQWNWLSRCIYFHWELFFFEYYNWCWKKNKKNRPSLNWPHLLGSSMLNFAEQAIWQSRSRGEGELQADLKHWNLLLSNQTGENGAEVNSVRHFSVLAMKTVLMVANIYWTDQLSRSGTLLSGPSI